MQTRRKGKKQPSDFEAWPRWISSWPRSTFEELGLIRARPGSPTKLRSVLVCRYARVVATAHRDIAFGRVGVR